MLSAVFLPIFDECSDPRVVARLAALAEEFGWHGFFVWDHVGYRPPVEAIADPWVTLAAVAGATERLRLGPMVTPLPRRRPVKVARETATLDLLSAGRLTFGVGIANGEELPQTGEELDAKVRGRMLDEGLAVLAAAWSGETVHHRGEHYVVDGIRFLPRPVQRPGVPVWVAARYGNLAPLRRAARHEGVFPIGITHPDQLAELVATVTAERTATGPYDVVVGGPPGTDPAGFEQAGATWWAMSFPVTSTVDQVTGVLRDGPVG